MSKLNPQKHFPAPQFIAAFAFAFCTVWTQAGDILPRSGQLTELPKGKLSTNLQKFAELFFAQFQNFVKWSEQVQGQKNFFLKGLFLEICVIIMGFTY